MAFLKACITSATFLPHLHASGNQVFKITDAELCPFSSCKCFARQRSPVAILSVCLCEDFSVLISVRGKGNLRGLC